MSNDWNDWKIKSQYSTNWRKVWSDAHSYLIVFFLFLFSALWSVSSHHELITFARRKLRENGVCLCLSHLKSIISIQATGVMGRVNESFTSVEFREWDFRVEISRSHVRDTGAHCGRTNNAFYYYNFLHAPNWNGLSLRCRVQHLTTFTINHYHQCGAHRCSAGFIWARALVAKN